jgi:hypothetical protein
MKIKLRIMKIFLALVLLRYSLKEILNTYYTNK